VSKLKNKDFSDFINQYLKVLRPSYKQALQDSINTKPTAMDQVGLRDSLRLKEKGTYTHKAVNQEK